MTSYLIRQGRLSPAEQSRLFIRGIAPLLWEQISRRLQLKLPDHYPDDLYTLEQVILCGEVRSPWYAVERVEFFAISEHVERRSEQPGNRGYGGNGFAGPRYQPNAPPPPPPRFPNAPYPQQDARPANNNNNFCHYCGNINCRLRTCPFVEEDTRAGRCRRDMDGRVILPNGSYVPRSLPNFDGVTMRDRVFEWNRRNANAMAPPDQQNAPAAGQPGNQAAQLFFAVAPKMPPAVVNFHLTTDERISQLDPPTNGEHDLPPHMSAQAPRREELREVSGGDRPATKSRETSREHRATLPTDRQGTEERRASSRATATAVETSRPAEGGQLDGAQRPPTPRPAPEQPESAAYPEHPFAKARDATYAPPKARNFGAPPAKTKESDRDLAYRTQAPVHNPKVAEEIFAHSMKAPVISLLPEKLLSIAPEVRAKYHEAVTPRRVPATKTVAFAQFTEELGEDCEDVDNAKPFLSTVTCNGEALEPGGYVLPDPYEVYLRDVAPEDDPKSLVITKESHALRSIIGLMANKEYVEGVVDPGCMVIAMSEEACHALGLWYDPSVTLRMVSANGEVDSSLGLVRNVPFKVADIVLYLQVHVIRNAAYDLLLGRPFDVLTKSVVKNFNNEDQTITISCPNTGQVATIPTIKRTSGRFRGSSPSRALSQLRHLTTSSQAMSTKSQLSSARRKASQKSAHIPKSWTLMFLFLLSIYQPVIRSRQSQRRSYKQKTHKANRFPLQSLCLRSLRLDLIFVLPILPRDLCLPTLRSDVTRKTMKMRKTDAAQPDRADTFTFAERPRPVFTFSYETEEGSYTVTPRGECEPASILLTTKKKYKPVAKKVRASLENCPEKFHIERNITGDPLATMPELNPQSSRVLAYRTGDFLWPEERKLLHDFMCKHNDGFAWSDSERGCFKPEFFPPIEFPVLPHTPWVEKNIPIPPGLYKEVCEILKKMITAGRPCGAIFDLYVGYDERLIAESSRDLTTFQTPFGALRHCTLPMGWSNSVPIFHDDVTYILRPEIPHITVPYIDDVPCKGPESDYRDEGGTYETIAANPGIRRFIWEHFANINRVVQRMKYAGGTFSGTKSILCAREIMVVGHHCTPEGCLPDESRVAAIKKWGPCRNLSEVRAFLGTIGVAWIFIHNFAKRAHPLIQLTRKGVPFEFGEAQLKAMEDLKQALLESPALCAINYESPAPVILAVDTSYIAVGYHLAQCDEQKPQIRYYSRFGSITLNEQESRFSQPKLELYVLELRRGGAEMSEYGPGLSPESGGTPVRTFTKLLAMHGYTTTVLYFG
ncbi:hypothetical protein BN946_scf184860.g3 [Trametes cinnabarina]|uniref:Reverse transcriptase/retrotransposon-derived protein RNase H-like domain-containing protein n=1 Tax=Pycnoporus cinnabarinus TaxID=5643 RepID=A0A060SVE8_PYCCI|nr:hypothetical protein BN946_scf184860.g3 [Trametes cinnabarina]